MPEDPEGGIRNKEQGARIEGLEDSLEKILTFPRIEVTEDSIRVLEVEGDFSEEWEERDFEVEALDDSRDVFLEEDYFSGDEEEEVSVVLSSLEEEVADEPVVAVVAGSERESEDSRRDFYSVTGDAVKFYEEGQKYDAKVSVEAEEVRAAGSYGMIERVETVDFEEERRGGRSVLELAGFRDEEAEKKRKAKRDSIFG